MQFPSSLLNVSYITIVRKKGFLMNAYITFSTNARIENDANLKNFIENSPGKFSTIFLDNEICLVIKPLAKETYEEVRHLAGSIARELRKRNIVKARLDGAVLESGLPTLEKGKAVSAFVEGWELGSYQFLRYKSEGKDVKNTELELVGFEDVQNSIQEGKIRANAVMFTRDLMNEIPSELNPETYPKVLEEAFQNTEAKVTVYRKPQLEEMGMNGILKVGQGSKYEPSFVEISYCSDPTKPLIALVGKGVTFDTGGISIKTGRDISDMKMDMGGSAAVAGAMKLLVDSKVKVNVIALLPIVENMPDQNSFLPSEVIRYKNGLTVQVGNTDAEGRLILADGIIRAGEHKAKYIIDIATLTGAIGSALGLHLAGVFGDEALAEKMKEIGFENGDPVWPLPLIDEYDMYLDGTYADLNNMSSRGEAGAITAALFLRRFVPKDAKWLHIDMANVTMSHSNRGYYPKTARGFGARLLADFVTTISN